MVNTVPDQPAVRDQPATGARPQFADRPVPEPIADLRSLSTELAATTDFESAAARGLGALVDIAESALASGPFRGSILRAVVHLRPDGGYAGLYVLPAASRVLTSPTGDESFVPSATVWQWISAHRDPVAVDTALGVIQPRGAEAEIVDRFAAPPDDDAVIPDASQVRMLDRDATHLYVLPLVSPGGVVGMISVEARCRAATGTPFIWPKCADRLELTATLAAPYLISRTPAAPPAPDADPLLPVVGTRMRPIVQMLRAFAGEDETLLIRGETGSGKSRIARWCHARSERADGPFETLDLLSVPEEIQMGELFGWKKGAFTGAQKDHRGFVERASGGTLFLDEIDKLSLKAQAALLYLLEEKRFRALGDASGPRSVDVRFIVGTNADLQMRVAEGAFREDLYYRINVLPMVLPPLRDRRDEIPIWAGFMLMRRHADRHPDGLPRATLSDEAAARLARLDWPGNLRQLDNLIRRAYTLASMDAAGGDIEVDVRQIELAAGLEGPGEHGAPLGDMCRAMRKLVAALAERDEPPDLEDADLAGALQGFLMATAVRELDNRELAFQLLGRGALVRNRNHHKALKREWERAIDFCQRVGHAPPAELAALFE